MKIRSLFMVSLLVTLLTLISISPANAVATDCVGLTDLDEQIECAIQEGLDYLIPLQNVNGSWYDSYTYIAGTGLICAKLIDRAKELGVDPFSVDYVYRDNLVGAINYVAGNLQASMGGLAQLLGGNTTYATGISTMCLAAAAEANPAGTASAGGTEQTYPEITQGLVNWLIAAQNTGSCGEGGWVYDGNPANPGTDNSVSGYATLGLGFASSLVGIDISATLTPLNVFINNIQRNGGPFDGGSEYQACGTSVMVNTLKTGNLLYELGLVGADEGDSRVDRAVGFIALYWASLGGLSDGAGWRNDYQAMFTMMKGLAGLNIDTLPGPIDWFTDVATYIVTNQNNDGYWPSAFFGSTVLNTAWALLTLEKAVPELIGRVGFDIKPGSCPNPLNVNSKGVLPAAILGSASFDVSQIDTSTLTLNGVSPISVNGIYDVSQPYVGELVDCDSCVCGCDMADGFDDLLLKFDTQEVVDALGEVSDGDCPILEITGNLKEEFGGTPIIGEDVLRILKKSN